ncbi:MAG TPA: T9SS type A sorting domain-containing protein [Ignavibacteria bacterium]|nr:T9SS type A sorting domain-containing protein [Ignavibacteria bacterium]
MNDTVKFFMIILVFFVSISAHADWELSQGFPGGPVMSLTSSGNYIFAGTSSNGVYYSTNSGNNWMQTSLFDKHITSMAANANYIYASSYNSDLYISSDFGSSWTGFTVQYAGSINDIAVNGEGIYLAAQNGVFISTNNGNNWSQVSMNNESVYAIAVSGNYVFAGTSLRIMMSSNNGIDWIPALNTNNIVRDLYAEGNRITAGISGSGVIISTNSGFNWSQTSLDSEFVSSVLSTGNTIYAGIANSWYSDGVEVSTNNGASWTKTLNSTSITSFTLKGTSVFTGTLTNGVYYTTNSGIVWVQTNMNNQTSNCLLYSNGNIYAGLYSGVCYSSDNGYSWNQTGGGETKSLLQYDNKILQGTTSGVYATSNGGTNWYNLGLNNFTIYTLFALGNTIFAGTNSNLLNWGGIFFSSNGGLNWNRTSWYGNNADVYSLVYAGGNFFAATINGLYKSTNNGYNWSHQAGIFAYTLFTYDSIVLAGTNGSGVYISSNYGINWSQTSMHDKRVLAINRSGDYIFAGTIDSGVYISSNNGSNWIQKNQGFNYSTTVSALLVNNGFVFAGTWNKFIWRRNLSDLTGITKTEVTTPQNFILHQNYPNPFNPTTTIKFDLPKSSAVRLSVYDITGKEIETLVNEKLNAGTYETKWDAAKYASGVYFCILTANNERLAIRRMVLIK